MRKIRKYFAGVSCGLLATLIICVGFGASPVEVPTNEPVTVMSVEETVDVSYRLTEGDIQSFNQYINMRKANVIQSDMLEAINEAVLMKEDPELIFPFETKNLGDMKIIANSDRDNKSGSKNFDGMTVSINPEIVPYGGIVYIEELGFRYNQPSDVYPDSSSIYLYFVSEEDVSRWNNSNVKVYFVHNDKNINILSEHDIEVVSKGKFHLTAYCPCVICCEGYADDPEGKTGSRETNIYQGTTIAADPRVLPYGSVVYIEGVGIRFVADCGGCIKGNDIDVYFTDHDEAWNFGTNNSDVWVLQ